MFPDEIFEQIIQVTLNATPEVVEPEEESVDEMDEQPDEDMMLSPWDDSKFWEAVEGDEQPQTDIVEGQESLSNLWGSETEEQETNKEQTEEDEKSITKSEEDETSLQDSE